MASRIQAAVQADQMHRVWPGQDSITPSNTSLALGKNDLHVRSDRFALTALRSWTGRILFHQ
jgi:hypothetical protein